MCHFFFCPPEVCCCRRMSIFLKRCIITNWPLEVGQLWHVSLLFFLNVCFKKVSHLVADTWWLDWSGSGEETSAIRCTLTLVDFGWVFVEIIGCELKICYWITIMLQFHCWIRCSSAMWSFGGPYSGRFSLMGNDEIQSHTWPLTCEMRICLWFFFLYQG